MTQHAHKACCPHANGNGDERCVRCVALRLAVSVSFVRRELHAGLLTPSKAYGRGLERFTPSDIARYEAEKTAHVLAERQRKAPPPCSSEPEVTSGGADSNTTAASSNSRPRSKAPLKESIGQRLRTRLMQERPPTKTSTLQVFKGGAS